MSALHRSIRFVIVALTIVVAPSAVFGQELPPLRAPIVASAGVAPGAPSPLRIATIAASAAAAADWASTYHALKNYHVRETNPLLSSLDHRPGQMVALGAAIDVGAITAWNMTVGKKHPKLATAGLWAMTAFRGYLAVHNMRNTRRATPR
jgi:hypothetical protein